MNIFEFIKNILKNNGPVLKDYDSLESSQQEMIKGVFEFGKTTVKEIMVPRIDAEFIQAGMRKDSMLKLIADSEHSRFPVYEGTIDNVIGVVYVKDILKKVIRNEEFKIEELIHKAFFVPESKHIDDLLHEFKARHVHIAIVVDEYGGVSGLVSLEDIIEEIVGDIQDEFDNEREDIVKISDEVWICDARINLEDLSNALNAGIPNDESDTLGGFVFNLLGRIPVMHEKVSYNNIDFIVNNIDGRKIITVKVILRKETPEEAPKN